MTDEKYKTVSGDFYDELEELSTLKKEATIRYRSDDGEQHTVMGHIANIYTENHEEFLKMRDGFTLRLDRILEVKSKHADFVK